MSPPEENPARGSRRNRKRAVLAVVPLLSIAAFDLVLLLGWGLDPLWGFAILPPIVFVSVLAWVYFSAPEDDSDDHEEGDADRADPSD